MRFTGDFLFCLTPRQIIPGISVTIVIHPAASDPEKAEAKADRPVMGQRHAAVSVLLLLASVIQGICEQLHLVLRALSVNASLTPVVGLCPDEDLGNPLSIVVTGNLADDDNDLPVPEVPCGVLGFIPNLSADHALLWTASAEGFVDFDLDGTNFDAILTLYQFDSTNCLGTQIACSDSSQIFDQPMLRVPINAGDGIVVVIQGQGLSTGQWILNVTANGGNVGDTTTQTTTASTTADGTTTTTTTTTTTATTVSNQRLTFPSFVDCSNKMFFTRFTIGQDAAQGHFNEVCTSRNYPDVD